MIEYVKQTSQGGDLAESLSGLRNLYDAVQAGIILQSASGEILHANRVACDIFGRGDDEFTVRTSFDPVGQMVREDGTPLPMEDHPFMITRRTGRPLRNTVLGVWGQDRDNLRWLQINTAPILDPKTQAVKEVAITFQDITALKQAEETINNALKDKEALLQELYHRTRNNMQSICALLNLQAAVFSDPRVLQAFENTVTRIHSMALAHNRLYQTQDLSRIDLKDYIKDIADFLLTNGQKGPSRISLQLDLQSVRVNLETAMPCGQIAGELMTKAINHAFPNGRQGTIKVALGQQPNGDIELRVADNGVGLPPDFDLQKTDSIGYRLVTSLGERQLQGKLELRCNPGTEFRLRFRELDYKPRI